MPHKGTRFYSPLRSHSQICLSRFEFLTSTKLMANWFSCSCNRWKCLSTLLAFFTFVMFLLTVVLVATNDGNKNEVKSTWGGEGGADVIQINFRWQPVTADIRTHIPIKRTAEDRRLKRRSQRNRHVWPFTFCNYKCFNAGLYPVVLSRTKMNSCMLTAVYFSIRQLQITLKIYEPQLRAHNCENLLYFWSVSLMMATFQSKRVLNFVW